MNSEQESLFWADQWAHRIIKRVESDDDLKKVVKKNGYICMDEKTPSGHIHIGSGRGWVITDAIAKALRDQGVKGRFILGNDDIDPFDKFPNYLKKEKYEKYLGMPFRDIPSPEKGYKSYADYYFKECTEKFDKFGIEAELQSTGENYDKGLFNDTIKIALDNTKQIQDIYRQISGEDSAGVKKLPFNPICEKCGKIGTTEAYEWDAEKEVIKYRCRKDLVKWAQGCGYEGERSPYNGGGKFPWKVEWAAKWPSIGVVYETAGKDHFTHGGSRTVAVQIATDVFKYRPPLPSDWEQTGKGYEFFTVGGKKMSTSKGSGIGFATISEHVPPKLLRYLLIKTRPRAVLDFDPYDSNKLLLLYDSYDATERIYFGKDKKENERELAHEKRLYELAHVGALPKKLPLQIGLGHASMVVQSTNFDIKKSLEILKGTGHIPAKTSKEDLDYVKQRLTRAKQWIEEFAPEQYKFIVQEKVPAEVKELSKEEKKALNKLSDIIGTKKWKEKELESAIYEFAKEELTPKQLFRSAYLALLGKERGPRLAQFVLSLDRKFVLERFKV
jgi:lysyl-tRNA synthetase class 1